MGFCQCQACFSLEVFAPGNTYCLKCEEAECELDSPRCNTWELDMSSFLDSWEEEEDD